MASNSPNPSSIRIRAIKTCYELQAIEELQLEVWECSEREVLPALALIPLIDIGGVLLGAFDQQELIGFVVGFPGIESGQLILHSDMLAVRRSYRSAGVGYKLKLAQREAALAKGIDRITWTFDPLQSANAHLNFARLGVTADRYKIDYYGETSSPLHRTGTDRLWVTWDLRSERVERRVARGVETAPPVSEPTLVKVNSADEPVMQSLDLERLSLRIEIPDNMNDVVAADESRARRWREATRAAFTSALANGFVVVDFFRTNQGQPGSYLLSKTR
ncbi:MAG TPA: GNAT family N-acetyltransferase [Pyrinomonadaceae bacterium]|nr:GNAT family N-acetyltransferase [Pyrinomonadaceae bacterium]